VYNSTVTNTQEVFDSLNDLTPSMKFAMGKELDNKINFLDISIQKEHDTVTFSVYRKPTTTDSIIPNDSCHPREQNYAGISYLANRMNTYKLNVAHKEEECSIFKRTLHQNKLNASLSVSQKRKITNKK
jgi:hypothetical protein